jgi:hypothetical protein
MNNKSKKISYILFLILTLYPSLSNASTQVRPEDVLQNWSWNKEGSPYILNDSIYIPQGSQLKIEKGVEIMSSSDAAEPYSISVEGEFSINGTKEEPVNLSKISAINFSRSSSTIIYSNFIGVGLDFVKSTTTLQFVNIKNAFSAITARGSNISILNSSLENNHYGIMSNFYRTTFLASLPSFRDTVTAKKINKYQSKVSDILAQVVDTSIDTGQNIIKINKSRIINSVYNGIINETSNTIDARHNWWGKSDGPNSIDISGSVNPDPWLTEDPNVVTKNICCSNVLFIPGIEASRLYKDQKGLFGLGTSTNTLWEPNRNGDVRNLYMDTNGKSITPNIYTKDIIGVVPGIRNIYHSYIETMDKLVADQVIKAWLPIPYDWRHGVYDIVDSTLLNRVIELAQTSKTGKVVIVAHSNGGLFTKQLMIELEKIGKSEIIEKVINVAVPELGTPQAVLAMLNGYDQGILLGAILSENNARTFSQNMPGAYGLLPTQRYFDNNRQTIISDMFSTSLSSSTMISSYINKIASFEGFKDFLLNGPFSKISSTNLKVPLKLNSTIYSKAYDLHKNIDNWKPASSTKVISIFGTGIKTPSSVTYKKDPHCDPSKAKCNVDYLAEFRPSGDGTVLTDAKSGNSNSTLFFNLKKVKNDVKRNISHANILESSALLNKIVAIIKDDDYIENDYNKYFTDSEPLNADKYLTVTVFSPVDIHVYDEDGLHSGPTSDTPIEPGQALPRENNIPDVTYATFADNTRVIVPYGNGKNYKIIMSGKASGVFIVDADISENDSIIASTTFAELPVFKQTNMEFVAGSDLSSFATNTVLNIDVDGDSKIDVIGRTNSFLNSTSSELIKDPYTFLEILNKAKAGIKLSNKDEIEIDKKIEKIKKHLDKRHKVRLARLHNYYINRWFKNRKPSDDKGATVAEIGKQLDRVLEMLEKNERD